MTKNLFETNYETTKKSKLKEFYEIYKIYIYSFIIIFLILLGSFNYYLEAKNNKKILLSENYFKAKIYLENGNNNEALNILKENILANDTTYSTLSLFLVLNENLIVDHDEISSLFDHLLINNKYKEEDRDLLIYKKIIFSSNFASESQLLEDSKMLLTKETFWKPHVLLLVGDYFVSKKENIKAKDFYTQILMIKNLHRSLYEQTQLRLASISNEK